MYLKKHQGKTYALRGSMAVLMVLLIALLGGSPAKSETVRSQSEWERLESGEVILDSAVNGSVMPLVQGKILIKCAPDKVWQIVVNPLEFAGKIQKHIRKYHFLKDTPRTSVLDCQVEVASFLPRFNYVVESNYDPCKRIEFKRVGGALKDFRGYWLFEPKENGTKTLVTYAMYLDPGFFVPQWIIRQGLKHELPETLGGIRSRVLEIEAESHQAIAHKAS